MNKKTQVKFINKDRSQFYATVKKRVDSYFAENKISRKANAQMVLKTIILFCFYLVPFAFIVLLQPSFPIMLLLWLLTGFGLAGIGMSVMHDANHGAYSKHEWVNTMLGHALNLVGGSVINWKMQHNILHHTYTNISPLDEDISDKVVILRFSPHTNVQKVQKGQHIYAFFLYGITTLYWATFKDIVQYLRYTRTGIIQASGLKKAWVLTRMIFDKLIYLSVFIGFPVAVGIPFGEVLAGFLIMHFIAGLVLTVVFQLAHTVEGTSHPVADPSGQIPTCWSVHQMNTTVDFSHGNKFLTWYLGGLNYQVEHHLFPKICHIHYPAIAPIVQKTAREYNVPYLQNKTFGKAFRSHLNTLKRFGRLPELSEAIN
jgi:linoleoyl-CoA desaturase